MGCWGTEQVGAPRMPRAARVLRQRIHVSACAIDPFLPEQVGKCQVPHPRAPASPLRSSWD